MPSLAGFDPNANPIQYSGPKKKCAVDEIIKKIRQMWSAAIRQVRIVQDGGTQDYRVSCSSRFCVNNH